MILGGGSPKNFLLQTEPQIQEVLGIAERGHDYFIQFTDARVEFNLITVVTVLYYAIFSSVLALSFLIFGIKRIGPNRASPFSYIVPVLTGVMAIAFLGETFEIYHAAGIVLVLGGVYLASEMSHDYSRPANE